MVEIIKNCTKYAYLVPHLETIENGSLIDIIELKLELLEVETEKKLNSDDIVDGSYRRELLDYLGSLILIRDKIDRYKKARAKNDIETTEELKIAILKDLLNFV